MNIDLDAIQRRPPYIPEDEMSQAERDRAHLFAYARDLEARIGRVDDIARQIEVSAEPRGVEEFYAIGKVSARVVSERLRAALTATEGAA